MNLRRTCIKERKGISRGTKQGVQKCNNAKTNVLPLNITVGDYIMTRNHAKREHKLKSHWCGPMPAKEAKSSLVFFVEDLIDAKQVTVHTQLVIPFAINKTPPRASEEFKQQAIHFDTTFHLVDDIRDTRKRKGEFQVLIKWSELEEGLEMTWKTLHQIRDDIPGVLKYFLYTAENRSLKRNALDLYF